MLNNINNKHNIVCYSAVIHYLLDNHHIIFLHRLETQWKINFYKRLGHFDGYSKIKFKTLGEKKCLHKKNLRYDFNRNLKTISKVTFCVLSV